MFITDAAGEPIYPPPYDLDDDYDDLVLVVRGGVPILSIIERLGLDASVIDRLISDGVIDLDLKPINGIGYDKNCDEMEALDGALIRLFAEQYEIDAVADLDN
jgi:hypothetical protein